MKLNYSPYFNFAFSNFARRAIFRQIFIQRATLFVPQFHPESSKTLNFICSMFSYDSILVYAIEIYSIRGLYIPMKIYIVKEWHCFMSSYFLRFVVRFTLSITITAFTCQQHICKILSDSSPSAARSKMYRERIRERADVKSEYANTKGLDAFLRN